MVSGPLPQRALLVQMGVVAGYPSGDSRAHHHSGYSPPRKKRDHVGPLFARSTVLPSPSAAGPTVSADCVSYMSLPRLPESPPNAQRPRSLMMSGGDILGMVGLRGMRTPAKGQQGGSHE